MDPSDKTIAPYVPATVLDGQRTVTVFGASGAQPGDALWQTSVALGSLLARKGYTLVNGGYMGTMEATALGAKQAGGRSYGVVVPKLFVERHRLRGANPNLTGVIATTSLLERIELLLHGARDAIVVLPGSLGTLQEIVSAWSELRLAPMHAGPRPPQRLLAWEDPWRKVIEGIADSLDFPQDVVSMVEFVSGVDDVDNKLPSVVA
eukprot:m51a1_g6476 hypothetical protein (206) ;mRNA; r:93824-94813